MFGKKKQAPKKPQAVSYWSEMEKQGMPVDADPLGSYTGMDMFGGPPDQDADDL